LPLNLSLIQNYITENPKIIVLERPIIDIVKSFVAIAKNNNENNFEKELLIEESEPIMRSFVGVQWAKQNNHNNNYLFIKYDDLINDTKEIINKIYSFIEEPIFQHDLNNIINKYPENDKVYNMIGQHDIRPTISKRKIDVELLQETIDKCKILDTLTV